MADRLTTAPVTWSTKLVKPDSIIMGVRYWSKHSVDTKVMRDKAIVTARGQGATLRQIADAADLTASGVAKILAKKSCELG